MIRKNDPSYRAINMLIPLKLHRVLARMAVDRDSKMTPLVIEAIQEHLRRAGYAVAT